MNTPREGGVRRKERGAFKKGKRDVCWFTGSDRRETTTAVLEGIFDPCRTGICMYAVSF